MPQIIIILFQNSSSYRANSRGEFSAEWSADYMDPFDSVVEFYAVFEGSSNYGSSRSV